MFIKKKIVGIILISIGLGMFLVLFIPAQSYILAGLLIIIGFIFLYHK